MKWRHFIGYALLIAVVMWGCSSCGYDGSYRYPCQDSANWENPECQPPLCNPSGTCTRDLIYEEPPQT